MRRPSVLIIDDMAEKIAFIECNFRSMFGADAWEIVSCRTESQALKTIEQRGQDFSLALIDTYLTEPPRPKPEAEGFGLARRLRQVNPGVYIILISRFIDDRSQVPEGVPIDDFLHFIYTTRSSNPVASLHAALRRAEQHLLLPQKAH